MADTPTQQGTVVALADAVVAALSGAPAGTFGQAFTAQRRFATVTDLTTLAESTAPLVQVVPAVDSEERLGGGATGSFQGDYSVDVVIFARVGVGDAAETACAALMLLRQQIRDSFKRVALTVAGTKTCKAVLSGIDGDPAFGQRALIEWHCFVSAQTLKFRLLP